MNSILFIYFLSLSACVNTPNPSTTGKDSAILFVGTTPCGNIIRPLHKINPEPDCDLKECRCIMVEWKLTLYQNPFTQKPGRYKLTSINRFSVKETNMYSQPGTRTESEGEWTIIQGTKTNPNAVLYQLNPGKPEITLSFIKLSDDLLHVVDHEGRLMIGNEFWSYTLSRVANP
jgi:hypothetical protein